MARPTWAGSIQISLVSIAVKIFPATKPGRQVEFHQISRETGKRVHHQNVSDEGAVDKADIVKGFEVAKGRYVEIEPEELKALRLATATTMQIKQFVKAEEVSAALYERPYFVAPKDEAQAKALGIMRKAMAETGTMGIGEIAFERRSMSSTFAFTFRPSAVWTVSDFGSSATRTPAMSRPSASESVTLPNPGAIFAFGSIIDSTR